MDTILSTIEPPGGTSKIMDTNTPSKVDTRENIAEKSMVEKKELATSKEAIGGMDIKDAESTSPTALIERTMLAQARATRE